MEKTHLDMETNIMGKKGVLYMQPYDHSDCPLLSVSRRA